MKPDDFEKYQLSFTLWQLREAWDKALAGSTVGERTIPVARSFESYSYCAMEDALLKIACKKKKAKKRK